MSEKILGNLLLKIGNKHDFHVGFIYFLQLYISYVFTSVESTVPNRDLICLIFLFSLSRFYNFYKKREILLLV